MPLMLPLVAVVGNMLYSIVIRILKLCSLGKSCEDGDVRLTNLSNGRVELCWNGIWGAVCTDRWDHEDAVVVCRQLKYDSRGNPALLHVDYPIFTGFPLDARVMPGFEAGETRSVFLSKVECTGSEENLISCISPGVGYHFCEQKDRAGVSCGKISESNYSFLYHLLSKVII